jgi:transcriptional regulator with XRE-family HTH domain
MARLTYACMLDTGRLMREREKQGLSMAAAAKAAGMIPQAWERLEKGDGLSLTLKTLNRVAKGLKVPAKELLK